MKLPTHIVILSDYAAMLASRPYEDGIDRYYLRPCVLPLSCAPRGMGTVGRMLANHWVLGVVPPDDRDFAPAAPKRKFAAHGWAGWPWPIDVAQRVPFRVYTGDMRLFGEVP